MRDIKKAKKYYSGKNKRHTLKTQVVVNKLTTEIICLNTRNGKMHDFKMFKESKTHINRDLSIIVDSGYQGLQKVHANTKLHKKRRKNSPLTKEDKTKNRELSSVRVVNENVIGVVKRHRILAEKYRNRRKRDLTYDLI